MFLKGIHIGMKKGRKLLLLMLTVMNCNLTFAEPEKIATLIINKESRLHNAFANSLKKKTTANINIKHFTDTLNSKGQFLIALGNDACKMVLESVKNRDILCTLIPSFEFSRLTKNSLRQKNNIGAIYIDQPNSRRLALLKENFPNIKNIAVIKSASSPTKNITADNHTMSINSYTVKNSQEIFKLFAHIKEKNDAILATEDKLVYNNKTIRQILLLSYRNKLPIFGFSKSFVKAGAVASVYSSIENLTEETKEVIDSYFSNRKYILKSKHPKYYSISFNEQVIQALSIPTSKRANGE